MLINLLYGLLIGFIIALPTGPVGLLCVRKTLIFGKKSGIFSVFGSVFADIFFSAAVVFGLTFILSFFEKYSLLLQIVGGILFMYIAWRAQKIIIDENAVTIKSKTFIGDFFEIFALTFTSPTFIFTLSFIFSIFHIGQIASHVADKLIFLVGITGGSLIWWLGFVFITDYISKKRKVSLRVVNKISAYVMGIAGAFLFVLGAVRLILKFV